MKKNILKFFILGIALSTVIGACRKDEFVDEDNELGTKGTTIVKVVDGPEKSVFVDNQPNIANVDVFNVRKEAANNTSLNVATTVTLTAAPELISAYNTAHPISAGVPNTYEALPESLFTPGAGLTKTATGYTMSFASGEFAKDFKINLNFPNFDFSKKYCLAFKVTNTSEGKVTASSQNQIFAIIGVKNAWDGVYSVPAGTVTRYTNPTTPAGDALSGNMAGNPAVNLITLSATTVQISGLQWANAGGGVGGVDPITMTINPATNQVTQIRSSVATTMRIVPGADNKYDPATRTFTLNFDWNQTANKREILGLKLTYARSR